MSGGVGPSADISLPKDEQEQDETRGTTKPYSKLSFRQLNFLAIMIVLAASGMVCFQDLSLVLFSTLYIYFLSRVSFPVPISPPTPRQPVFDPKSNILKLYVTFAAIIGLFLPILYVFEGVFEGDKDGVKAAVPHVFLLASQVFMEGISVSDRFSLPIRVFVPVFYNSIRVFCLLEWVKEEMVKEVGQGSVRRLYVGRGLAILNFGFWCFNLFGFLLPVYLPRALKIYYATNVSSSKKD